MAKAPSWSGRKTRGIRLASTGCRCLKQGTTFHPPPAHSGGRRASGRAKAPTAGARCARVAPRRVAQTCRSIGLKCVLAHQPGQPVGQREGLSAGRCRSHRACTCTRESIPTACRKSPDSWLGRLLRPRAPRHDHGVSQRAPKSSRGGRHGDDRPSATRMHARHPRRYRSTTAIALGRPSGGDCDGCQTWSVTNPVFHEVRIGISPPLAIDVDQAAFRTRLRSPDWRSLQRAYVLAATSCPKPSASLVHSIRQQSRERSCPCRADHCCRSSTIPSSASARSNMGRARQSAI